MPAPTRLASVSSESTLPLGPDEWSRTPRTRLVVRLQFGLPHARRTRRLWGWSPASHPRCRPRRDRSSCSAMRSLSSTVSEIPFQLRTITQSRVVDLDRGRSGRPPQGGSRPHRGSSMDLTSRRCFDEVDPRWWGPAHSTMLVLRVLSGRPHDLHGVRVGNEPWSCGGRGTRSCRGRRPS